MSNEIEKQISNTIDKIIQDIRKSGDYNLIHKKNVFKISKEIKVKSSPIVYEDDEKSKVIKYESKMIPADDVIRSLMFSLETVWSETKNELINVYPDFDINPSKYIYYDRFNKYKDITGGISKKKSNKCNIELKIEYDQKIIQYYNEDEFDIISFNYNYDFEEEDDIAGELYTKKENIENFITFCEYLLKKINNCGEFLSIVMTNWTSKCSVGLNIPFTSHRNIILVENNTDEICFNHYEPHGYNTDYYVKERKEFFYRLSEFLNVVNKKMYMKKINTKKINKLKKIIINPFSASVCVGIQYIAAKYDVGYCSLYSFFWLYCIMTIFFELKKYYKNINQKMIPLYKWSTLFEKIFINKFSADPKTTYKNSPQEMYDTVITFSYRLFENYFQSDLVNKLDLSIINKIQEENVDGLFQKYKNLKSTIESRVVRIYEKKPEVLDKLSFEILQKDEKLKQNFMDNEYTIIKKMYPFLYSSCNENKNCKNPNLSCNFDKEVQENICLHNFKKTLYSNCDYNVDCFSNICKNNMCIPSEENVQDSTTGDENQGLTPEELLKLYSEDNEEGDIEDGEESQTEDGEENQTEEGEESEIEGEESEIEGEEGVKSIKYRNLPYEQEGEMPIEYRNLPYEQEGEMPIEYRNLPYEQEDDIPIEYRNLPYEQEDDIPIEYRNLP